MLEFKKERNFINAYDATTKVGGWNISTGEFIGKSGKIVKGVPTCFVYGNLDYLSRNILSGAIRMFREYWGNTANQHWYGDYTVDRANRFEQMISLGIYPSDYRDLDSTTPLTKDLVNWIKTECNGSYNSNRINRHLSFAKYRSQLPEEIPGWVSTILCDLVEANIPSTFFIPALKRGIDEQWEYLLGSSSYRRDAVLYEIIVDYYRYSMKMWGNAKVEPNMLSKVCKIRKLYKDYENAHYDEILKENNDKSWLYFENHLLIAKPLLTREQFHDEATRQHNCVENLYMDRVKEGKTHVVSIRYKNLPDQSYITCEVSNSGKIIQYLTACNNRVTDRGGIDFQILYQNHLSSSLKE